MKRFPKELGHLKKIRVFLPAEYMLIFQTLGEPQYMDIIDKETYLIKVNNE
jgi:hypothetical protein